MNNKFKLDYIGGSTGLGVGTGTFGTVQAWRAECRCYSQILLGNHQVGTTLALNGDIYDFGGQITYVNKANIELPGDRRSRIFLFRRVGKLQK